MTDKDSFYRGFACAVATLVRSGWPSQAIDIMDTNGISFQVLAQAGCDGFDLKPIQQEWIAKGRIALTEKAEEKT